MCMDPKQLCTIRLLQFQHKLSSEEYHTFLQATELPFQSNSRELPRIKSKEWMRVQHANQMRS